MNQDIWRAKDHELIWHFLPEILQISRNRWLRLTAFTASASGFELIGLLTLLPFLRALADPSFLNENQLINEFSSITGVQGQLPITLALGGLSVSSFLLKNILLSVSNYLQAKFASDCTTELSTRLFRQYLFASEEFHQQRSNTDLLRSIRYTSGVITEKILIAAMNVVAESLVIIGVLAFLFWGSQLAAITTLSILGILFLTHNYSIKTMGVNLRQESDASNKKMQRILSEGLSLRTQISQQSKQQYVREARKQLLEQAALKQKRKTLAESIRPAAEVIMLFGILTITSILMALEISSGSLPLLAVFAVAAIRLLPMVNRILRGLYDIRNNTSALKTLLVEIRQLSSFQVTSPENINRSKGAILRTSDLRFRYKSERYPTLTTTNIEIAKNVLITVCGPSGSGKSTLLKLLCGQLQASSGKIQLSSTLDESTLNYLPQTLQEQTGSRLDWLQLDSAQAAEALCAVGFDIATMEPLEAWLEGPCHSLSGGQRKQLTLAKYLSNESPLLLLDNPLSGLDPRAKTHVLQQLKSLSIVKSIVFTTNDLSAIKASDEVWYMDKGKIQVNGAFSELSRRSNKFKSFLATIDS